MTDPVDDEMVGNLAESFGRRADEEGLSEFERVSFVTAFVQSLPYTPDNVTTDFDEYPRYPVETLVDDGGDCEDSSILLASVMDAMGYDVVLLELPGHMAVGVAGDETVGGSYVEGGGTRYFYVETTGENWEIGELPAEFEELPITIRGLEPVPVLVHSWSATSRGTRVDVNVTVNNVGTDVAEDVRVRCYFQTAEGSYGERISDALTLQPGSSGMYRFTLSAPRDGETRLFVEVLMEGSKVDESRSEPF
ncbi:MAG: hypothetical protein MAG715_00653 [Methanonatronarchaeales archaeon]|nr:hypothetical protein [Methanonatronarchaeales archaeon]